MPTCITLSVGQLTEVVDAENAFAPTGTRAYYTDTTNAESFCSKPSWSHWTPSKKLIPNLMYNKTHYVTHYRNLQFYIRHGMKLTKIHRVLSFSQTTWLKGWIDLCMTQRQNIRSEFEHNLAKLQVNSTYGKNDRARVQESKSTIDSRSRENPESSKQAILSRCIDYKQSRIFWALTVSNNSCKEETLKYLCLTTL